MVATIETTLELGLRRAGRGCRVAVTYPESSTGIAAGEVNFPGAAAQSGCLGTGFRAVDATNNFGLSPSTLHINGADTYQFVGGDPVGKVDPSGRFCLSCWLVPLDMADALTSYIATWIDGGALVGALMGGEEVEPPLVAGFFLSAGNTVMATNTMIGDAVACEHCDACPTDVKRMQSYIEKGEKIKRDVHKIEKRVKEVVRNVAKIIRRVSVP